ncbi:ribosomal protein L17 [Cryptococcus wingfieldii CBS 7118]|uniref:Ribosomal protein L17 n=1 Tax=Cryptococcus wingfieldii CBS 7118 TaxID=1295528 RepID=A0A1E3JYX9_9TREE|nr:ribosomal protein L17 [Cryptococcus wingfieldii CBS 7118]ODO05102.1 ribosomal protein L17 [Cryptococcus wingfieldii CBS 7118]
MKHGINQRRLNRMPAHRLALLRNLVSALLHHESIKTTLPKAKEAARMAEKIITLGKNNTNQSRSKAMALLMASRPLPPHHAPAELYNASSTNPKPTLPPLDYPSSSVEDPEQFRPPTTLLPKLFSTLADRYAARPGGYTRIQRYGRRPGDNAPHAILSLVDGPRDLKFELTARAVGREGLDVLGSVHTREELAELSEGDWEELSERTRRDVGKVLRYRSEEDKASFKEKAKHYMDTLQSESAALSGLRKPFISPTARPCLTPSINHPKSGKPQFAGERLSAMSVLNTGLGLARGQLGRQRKVMGQDVDRTARIWERKQVDGVQGEIVKSA